MRNLKLITVAAAACALGAGSLQAQTGQGYGKWMGVTSNASACYTPLSMGYSCFYTNPYHEAFSITSATRPLYDLPQAGVFGNATSFGPALDIFCVDYLDESNTGTYAVNYTNLGTDGGLVGTTTRSHTLTQYLEAAWLAQHIVSGQYAPNTQTAYEISGAMWQIMTGSGLGPTTANGQTAGIISWVTQATTTANWRSVIASDWVVVTDKASVGKAVGARDPNNNEYGGQEYLTHIVTPEPATLLLLGTGLMMMLIGAGVLRRPTA